MINSAITPIIIPVHRSSSYIPMTADQIKFTIIFCLVCLLLINAIASIRWIFKSDDWIIEMIADMTLILDAIVLFALIAFVIAKLVMEVL